MTMMCLWIICKHWLAFFLIFPHLSFIYLYNRAIFSLFFNFFKSSILWKFLWTFDINNSIIVIIWKRKHLNIFSQAFYILYLSLSSQSNSMHIYWLLSLSTHPLPSPFYPYLLSLTGSSFFSFWVWRLPGTRGCPSGPLTCLGRACRGRWWGSPGKGSIGDPLPLSQNPPFPSCHPVTYPV